VSARIYVWFAALALAVVAGAWRRRNNLARLEQRLRRLREMAMCELELRPVADVDTAELASMTEPLAAAGLIHLGYAVEHAEDARQPACWFADTAGTTFGWLGEARGLRFAFLMSAGRERATLTRCIPHPLPVLASPSFLDRADDVGPLHLARALATHRERLPHDPIVVRSLDDALRAVRDVRARTIAWREAQPPSDLLDRDLRAILGRHYDRLGPIMARRLGVQIPVARTL
jgi:hypothetical protein